MIIKVKVKPNSKKKTEIVSENDYIKLNVKAKPVSNEANLEVIKFLSKHYKKKVRIIKGFKSKEKLIELTD